MICDLYFDRMDGIVMLEDPTTGKEVHIRKGFNSRPVIFYMLNVNKSILISELFLRDVIQVFHILLRENRMQLKKK